MNTHIEFYVEQFQALLMSELTEKDESNLYGMANAMIKCHHEDEFTSICQAYEIVKHQISG